MSFENLSYRYTHVIDSFPEAWLPFIHLYDADLPLFPLYYFHVLPDDFPTEAIPRDGDRVFGYIERVHLIDSRLEVSIICNKDLTDPSNSNFIKPVIAEVEERIGISNRVTVQNVSAAFRNPYDYVNQVLVELWRRVVSRRLGDTLPFGRLLDPIFGLARLMASFYSPAGRKSELIQTHYFLSKFGEKIRVAEGLLQMDFYLLPTFSEVIDLNNNLRLFPKFRALCDAAKEFHRTYCSVQGIGMGLTFSKFKNPFTGTINTAKIMSCINSLSRNSVVPLLEAFNAFDKGPLRTIMFLQMLNDIRDGRLVPDILQPVHFGLIYDKLRGFYQTPKVIALYAQQCFGNVSAFPIDTWVETFMRWPLRIYPTRGRNLRHILSNANNPGKMERLLWISAQARKIHSSLCDDALWCAKYDSTGRPRGANPLSCNACFQPIRDVCPAYARIAGATVSFNTPRRQNMFEVWTSQKDNITTNQYFTICEGSDIYGAIHDDFTPVDFPNAFAPFPHPSHKGQNLTVEKFIRIY